MTLECSEPRLFGSVTASCYVLDAFLLFACSDGALRAHPRNNPKSTYHVLDLNTRISHLTGLYNVVAICHSHHVLEVRHVVTLRNKDPFIQISRLLFVDNNVDSSHRPLLDGPFVLYKKLDGQWCRVRYDIGGSGRPAVREILKVPWKAGWEIHNIKSANWRFWAITLVSNRQERQDVLFFVPQAFTHVDPR